ncbi:glycosyltransferase family 4 protein [Gottfriedia acidiceleris]|uniref:glycosyltransferase family 4 protein n=1 Tax=Gottfriedia acidiceleris TaxID=371036 RepID=UPI000B43A074|nr:glycosyltransferase family 4 protein [Gottfriedia acidiceleris]
MGKENILIVHNFYQIPGGEDSVVENEKNLLVEKGHNVFLYTRHNNDLKNKGIFGKLLLPLETIFSIKTYFEIKKIIRNKKIDIVHVHNTLPLISPSVYYAARHSNATVVQTIHNFRLMCPAATLVRNNSICEACITKGLYSAVKYNCYRNSRIQSLISALSLGFHRFIGTYKKVDGYITLTEFNRKMLERVIPKEKIYVKPNFVKNKYIKSNKSSNYFLFLGRLDELKGVKLLVEAWKTIKNTKLLIVGDGPLEKELNDIIKNYNLSNIELLGFKKKDEVMELIDNSKALVVPSQWYEGFPMTIAESFSLGTPVIAGDIGNLPTIVEDYKNGLIFKYNDINDLRNKINTLNENSELLEELSMGAKDSYNQKYNYDKNYKQLLRIYNTCKRGHLSNVL